MTLSLAAVFIPVLFMGGVVGRLLHEFAVTISAAILVSGFVSISLTPMLCSRFLKPPHDAEARLVLQLVERRIRCAARRLRLDARSVAPVQRGDDGDLVLLLVATGYLFTLVPKGFLPSEDTAS